MFAFITVPVRHCVQKGTVHLGYDAWIWLPVLKLPLKCAVVSVYSVVKQWLKCNTSKMWNRLIKFLLAMVLSIEKHVLHSDFWNALCNQNRLLCLRDV
jgi:hypothetical protein